MILIEIFQGLLTPIIGIAVIYIAWQQHKTNRDKLRLDLYNKRFEVFSSLMILLGHIKHRRRVKLEQINEFTIATKEKVFLFDEDIETYLQTVKEKVIKLWGAGEAIEGLSEGSERNQYAEEIIKLCDWFLKQHKVAVDIFGRYMKFEKL